MKRTYTSPVMTTERFVTDDIITISLHSNELALGMGDEIDPAAAPLPVIDANEQFS